MSVDDLRLTPDRLAKPVPGGLAVETTLQHFAIVTYHVDPSALRAHVHARFEPVCVTIDGAPRALVSVVSFLDRDFRFVAFPYVKASFGQTNYRAYVRDTENGDHVAWFFGTCLDSASVVIPRYLWKLPWHRAHLTFDCVYDVAARRYGRYVVDTRSDWSPGLLMIDDSGTPPDSVAGVRSLEAGLVLLTHPTCGYFFRRDGALGSYAIWHERAQTTVGRVREARYPLLERLELVRTGDVSAIHSVLLQPSIAFTIYLPPTRVTS